MVWAGPSTGSLQIFSKHIYIKEYMDMSSDGEWYHKAVCERVAAEVESNELHLLALL